VGGGDGPRDRISGRAVTATLQLTVSFSDSAI
jgi:hypothetical protein